MRVYQRIKGAVPLRLRVFLATRLRKVGSRAAHLDRTFLADKYLRGDGLEIGALHSPLPVPRAARVKYVDRLPVPELRRQYPELASLRLVNTDIVDDGERLASVANATQDFVIANHFVEHCQNPLDALGNMFRVLRPGGILYLAIPDKRFTFDADRPVTDVEHVVRDFEEGPDWSKRQHFEEWVRLVNKVEDEGEAARQVVELMGQDYSIHYHVWTQAEMFELFSALKRKLGIAFDVELFLKHHGECIFILRKTEERAAVLEGAAR